MVSFIGRGLGSRTRGCYTASLLCATVNLYFRVKSPEVFVLQFCDVAILILAWKRFTRKKDDCDDATGVNYGVA